MNPIIDIKVIRRPKRVNVQTTGPHLWPERQEHWQQPIWGNSVRLFLGAQDRWDPDEKATILIKPGQRRSTYDDVTIKEPDGSQGTSYTAFVEFVRACFRAGWYPHQVEDLLSRGQEHGPSAQYRWLSTRHTDEEWFLRLWDEVATTESVPFYAKQVNKRNRTLLAGPITFNTSDPFEEAPASKAKEFRYGEQALDYLRYWLIRNPGLTQEQVVDQAPMDSKVVTLYLQELERRGLAKVEVVKTGRRGRPPKMWSAWHTKAELDAKAIDRAERVVWAAEGPSLWDLLDPDYSPPRPVTAEWVLIFRALSDPPRDLEVGEVDECQ